MISGPNGDSQSQMLKATPPQSSLAADTWDLEADSGSVWEESVI